MPKQQPKRKLFSPPEKIRTPSQSLRASFHGPNPMTERIFTFRKKLRAKYGPR